jgi:mono/diheme cytochrome c family protein
MLGPDVQVTFMKKSLGVTAVGTLLVWLGGMIGTPSNPAVAEAVKGDSKASNVKAARTVAGLLALYDFRSTEGDVVTDRSGVGPPLNLRIANPKAVRRSKGALEIHGTTQVLSMQQATKIIRAVRRSGEITIEAWVRPVDIGLSGPARIVTLSRGSSERNFTLGQDGANYDVRFRTTNTNANGIPSLSTKDGSVKTKLTHVVYTRDRTGLTRVYINGKSTAETTIAGSSSKWIGSHGLALANEFNSDRQWKGTYYLVAIYSRDLSPTEVNRHFELGRDAPAAPPQLPDMPTLGAKLFETKIAPLLARNCLECHNSASKKGRLDLSRKAAALAGGESGKVIVPGKSAGSLLWVHVESGDMPPEGDPLTADQKTLLRQWIDAGATWSLDAIDPAIYAHDEKDGQTWVRRLTVHEYIETVRSAVGVDISQQARDILPPDVRADGFSNTAYNLIVDLKHVEAYSRLAEIIVGRMDVLAFAAKFSKSRSLSTDATMRDFVEAMGKQLLRGPLEEREISNYSGIATVVASTGGDFAEAVSYIIEAMLQSPRFIYLIENQRGDGSTWPVGEYELASRISYIVWGGPPDQELIRAAEASELQDRQLVEAQVRRMLQDPRAIQRSSLFITEWLDLDRLVNLQPNAKRFPSWDNALAADMRLETLAFFEDIVWKQDRPLADLLNAQFTYATPLLAKHYGLEVQQPSTKNDKRLLRYDLSSVPARGGLLTQGSVLTVGGDDASMVTRGLFVLHDLLRGTVKDPPPGLDTTPVPSKPGLSQRLIAEQRISNTACSGCHSKFEPLAFGLEKFDGIGAFHEQDEYGNKLRDDGEILFPGAAKSIKYNSSAELMNLLAESDRVNSSITWKLTQFAIGRPLVASDAREVQQIHELAKKGGGTYASLIASIVTSDLVMMTRTLTE